MSSAPGSGGTQDDAGARNVLSDLFHQGLGRIELLLVANALDEAHSHLLVVEVAAEVENERFHSEAVTAKSWAVARIKCPGVGVPGDIHPDRVDAVARDQLVGGYGQVGGRKTDATTGAGAVLHERADGVVPAEESGRMTDSSLEEQLTDSGAADDVSLG